MGVIADTLRSRLTDALAPARLEIHDDSAKHAGHGGARPDGETHFSLLVVADAFAGRSRVDRHRLVNAALGDLVGGRVHALALKTLTPEEAATAI